MIALFKRRWILLSCAVVLLVCSTVEYRHTVFMPPMRDHHHGGMTPGLLLKEAGIIQGAIRVMHQIDEREMEELWILKDRSERIRSETSTASRLIEQNREFAIHRPQLGSSPEFSASKRGTFASPIDLISIPLWLPLCFVIGWLVWRELRFREKRAKAADGPRASAS